MFLFNNCYLSDRNMYRSVSYRNAEKERSSDEEDVEYYNNNIHLPISQEIVRYLNPWR